MRYFYLQVNENKLLFSSEEALRAYFDESDKKAYEAMLENKPTYGLFLSHSSKLPKLELGLNLVKSPISKGDDTIGVIVYDDDQQELNPDSIILKYGLPKGKSILFEVEISKEEDLGQASERVANSIGANWWSNESKYGSKTYFENR